MKRILAVAVVALLASCASVSKIEGDQVVNGRLTVKVNDAWNRLNIPGGMRQPFEAWTQEGLAIDQLRFWAGIQSGQALVTPPPSTNSADMKTARVPTFQSGMALDQLVNLFEVMYSMDGSQVRLTKVEAGDFAGQKGARFEFTVTRKRDGLPLHGAGWVAVRNNELYGATFVAPRLTFYPALLPKAQQVVATARIKG